MVNTFLPFPDFVETAKALDYKRLGKQRVEAWQILQALLGKTQGWTSHPATKMWRGHERLLCEYGIAICKEWIDRGYKDTMLDRFVAVHSLLPECEIPVWLGDPIFHKSHQSNLMRKDKTHYDFHVLNDLPYQWFEGSGYNADQKLCVTYRMGATKYTQTFVNYKEREPYPEHIEKTVELWIREQKAGATN